LTILFIFVIIVFVEIHIMTIFSK